MKIEITKAQLEAIKNMADDMSAMVGCGDNDKIWIKYIKHVDKMLKNNGLEKRCFK